jgi:stage III sporulation protein SpoIIIAA|tara:strand:- start:2750 stop:4417 length:1668 start_codon:yes stop_codon:yes gene_type:complete
MLLADNLNQLLEILPEFVSKPLEKNENREQLIEIVLDIGRRPEARFANDTCYLSYRTIVWQDLDYIIKRLGKFSGDNRAGIEKTLHRISSLRNRQGSVIGLTCRVGRAVFGTISIIRDLLEKEKSILLLGRPGVGKTTAIREIARVLSDDMKKRVIIIDTSNEIAGDGDLPHPSIGRARRMQVLNHQNQHQVMIEAVENHMPEIIIIDEIGTELEAFAARTIAERGVQLVGTAHGNVLENLIKNPTLTDLVGGIQYVTLGDEEARRRGSSKSILERQASPTFEIAVEIHDPKTWIIHENIGSSVDLLLQEQNLQLQRRVIESEKNNSIQCDLINFQNGSYNLEVTKPALSKVTTEKRKPKSIPILNGYGPSGPSKLEKSSKGDNLVNNGMSDCFIFLYVYGINSNDLRSLIKMLNLSVVVTRELQYANVVLALGNLIKNNKKLRQLLNSRNIPIYTIQNNSLCLLVTALKYLINKSTPSPLIKEYRMRRLGNKLLTPLEEVRLVIEEIVLSQKRVVDLLPRTGSVRRVQHEIVSHYHLNSLSVGEEPNRHVRIYP